MGLKPDHWIHKMALEHKMIEPFADSQVREGVISYGVSSYGYDMRIADEFKIYQAVDSAVIDPKNQAALRLVTDFKGDVLPDPAQLLRPGAYRGILPHPARGADHLLWQVHLRPLRHHRQCHPLRARVGRLCHPGHLQHQPAASHASMPTRASPRCCSSRPTSRVRSPTPTRRANTSSSRRIVLPKL